MHDPHWLDVAAADAIAEDEVVGVEADGLALALYRVEGALFATSNTCTHGQARLCDGWLEGHEIECPLHQGRFDLRNGHALCAPLTANLRVFPTRVEAGRVYVAVERVPPPRPA